MVKSEGNDDQDDQYVVVEVIQDGTEEQYEDEGDELELEDEEEMDEEILEETESYTLTESEVASFLKRDSFCLILIIFADIDSDVIMSLKNSPPQAGSSAISFGFSEDEEDAKN